MLGAHDKKLVNHEMDAIDLLLFECSPNIPPGFISPRNQQKMQLVAFMKIVSNREGFHVKVSFSTHPKVCLLHIIH